MAYQFDNGIPILAFYDHAMPDFEMQYLTYFLERIKDVYDVRKVIKNTFWTQKLASKDIIRQISGVIEYVVEEIEDLDWTPDRVKRKSRVNHDTTSAKKLNSASNKNKNRSFISKSGSDKIFKQKKQSFCSNISLEQMQPI